MSSGRIECDLLRTAEHCCLRSGRESGLMRLLSFDRSLSSSSSSLNDMGKRWDVMWRRWVGCLRLCSDESGNREV